MNVLVTGQIESGKSTILRYLARISSVPVVSIDIYGHDIGQERTFRSDDDAEPWLRHRQGRLVLVDEASETVGRRAAGAAVWIANQSRHYGHSVVFATQRPIQVPPVIRDSCSWLYMLASPPPVRRLLADEFGVAALVDCELRPLEFVRADRFGKIGMFRICPKSLKIEEINNEIQIQKR